MTDPQAAFLERIRQEYPEDLPRLIYADWLEEQGDPRAEFIRVQCAMARLHRLDPAFQPLAERSLSLLRAHAPHWFGTLQRSFRGTVPHYLTRRGFAEELQLDLNWLRERLDRGLSVARTLPEVLGVRVRELAAQGPHLHELAETVFAHFPALNLSLNFLGDRSFAALFACPPPPALRELNLNSTLASPAAVSALAGSAWISRLTWLNLGANVLGDEGAAQLVRGPHPLSLKYLNLSNCGLTDEGLELLIASPLLSHLETLDLSGNRIEGDGLESLAEAPAAANLRQLLLGGGSELRVESLLRLAGSDCLPRLEVLDLSGGELHITRQTDLFEEFGRLLTDAARLPSLKVLDLRFKWMLTTGSANGPRTRRLSAATCRGLEERLGDGLYLHIP